MEELKNEVKNVFERRDERGELSKAHDWTHVNSVAKHARITAEELARSEGMKNADIERAGVLAEAAGYLHDLRRRATERTPHGDLVERFIRSASKNRRFKHLREGFTDEEVDAVATAVGLHEQNFEELEESLKKKSRMHKIIARALVAADKGFEASGPRVIERRSFFVGRERTEEGKDLHYLEEHFGDNAPLYAVAMESMIRLRARNAIKDYPAWLKPIITPLHETQSEFYAALLGKLGETEQTLFEKMRELDFPKFKKYEKKIRQNLREYEVQPITGEKAVSASKIVQHFVGHESMNEAINNSNAVKGKSARNWMKQIRGARSGGKEYLEEIRKALRTNLRKKNK